MLHMQRYSALVKMLGTNYSSLFLEYYVHNKTLSSQTFYTVTQV